MDERTRRSPATWLLLLLCAVATAQPAIDAGSSLLTVLGLREVDAAGLIALVLLGGLLLVLTAGLAGEVRERRRREQERRDRTSR